MAMPDFKEYWERLTPKKKRYVMMGVVGGAVALAMFLSGVGEKPDGKVVVKRQPIRNVLTDNDTREVSIDALAAAVRTQDRQQQSLSKDVGDIKSRIQALSDAMRRDGADPDLTQKFQKLQGQVDALGHKVGKKSDNADGTADSVDVESLFAKRNSPSPVVTPQGPRRGPSKAGESQTAQVGPKIVTIEPTVETAEKSDLLLDGKESEVDGQYLPSGSIITGVFLTGMDAPTGQGARRDLVPTLIRIQKEAILPNRFTSDVRECFMLASGYGELSSERAYIRAESISCVREDGGVIEATLEAYAVGEDAKAGVRGRVVSRQGSFIAKTVAAGFLSGVSKAFDVQVVPVISTNTSSNTVNQSSSQWLQSAAANGASSALEKVADFYLQLADEMFPVIEINALRQVDLVIQRGVKLQFKGQR